MNSKQLGNIALSRAMQYFAAKGWCVFIPLGDNGGDVDFIVSEDGVALQRIQCKYTSYTKTPSDSGKVPVYAVDLRSSSVKSGQGYISEAKYTPASFDFLYVSTPDSDYLIPWSELCENGQPPSRMTLSIGFEKYRL